MQNDIKKLRSIRTKLIIAAPIIAIIGVIIIDSFLANLLFPKDTMGIGETLLSFCFIVLSLIIFCIIMAICNHKINKLLENQQKPQKNTANNQLNSKDVFIRNVPIGIALIPLFLVIFTIVGSMLNAAFDFSLFLTFPANILISTALSFIVIFVFSRFRK